MCSPSTKPKHETPPKKKANLVYPNFDIVWRWQLKGKQLFGTVAALLLPDETLTWSYRITLKRLKYTFVITFAPVHNAGGTPAVMWQLLSPWQLWQLVAKAGGTCSPTLVRGGRCAAVKTAHISVFATSCAVLSKCARISWGTGLIFQWQASQDRNGLRTQYL